MSNLTFEDILAVARELEKLGPAPPRVVVSRHATGLPTGVPHTLDMQEMVERLGQSRVPAAYRFSAAAMGITGPDVIVVHPDLIPND